MLLLYCGNVPACNLKYNDDGSLQTIDEYK